MPDSVPLTQPGEPTAASVVSRLGEIRQRADAATKGPWTEAGDSSAVYETESGLYAEIAMLDGGDTTFDCAFIANAREDVPWLLDALDVALSDRDRARQENQRLREGIERLTLGDYDSGYSVEAFGEALLDGEDVGEATLPLPLSRCTEHEGFCVCDSTADPSPDCGIGRHRRLASTIHTLRVGAGGYPTTEATT